MTLNLKKMITKLTSPKSLSKNIKNEWPFGLIKDKEYVVMSLVCCKNALWYLIDENGFPNIYPAKIFEVVSNKIASDWFLSIKTESNIKFIMGYYEICYHESHYNNILLRKKEDIILYFEKKKERLGGGEYDYIASSKHEINKKNEAIEEDPRWPARDGWVKMTNKNKAGIEIHYVAQWKNGKIIAIDDFKFIDNDC